MKLLLTIHLGLLCLLGHNSRAQTIGQDDYLGAEMRMAGEEGGSEPALRKIRLLPPDKQSLILDSIVQNVRSFSTSRSADQSENANYIRVAVGILMKIGTDEQITRAFGDLSNFGNVEPDAAEALASCKGSGGVKIIRELAEKRLPELDSAINPRNQDEMARSNQILNPFIFLILRLDSATNPDGPLAAKSLRNRVAALYQSENGKSLVTMLDAEMTKARSRLEKATSPQLPMPSEGILRR